MLKFTKCVIISYHNLLLRFLGISYLTIRTFSLIRALALSITYMSSGLLASSHIKKK